MLKVMQRRTAEMAASVLVLLFALTGASALTHSMISSLYSQYRAVARTEAVTGKDQVQQTGSTSPGLRMCDAGAPVSTQRGVTLKLTFVGIDLRFLGTAWFLLVIIVELARHAAKSDARDRFSIHSVALSILGLAAVLAAAYKLALDIGAVEYSYSIAALCVVGVLASATSRMQRRRGGISAHLKADLLSTARRVPTWFCVTGFVGLVVASNVAAPKPKPGPMGAEFEAWYALQPRSVVGVPPSDSSVTIVAFCDYQCPVCRSAEDYYRPMIDRLNGQYPGDLRMIRLDYPLEPECNPYVSRTIHSCACEAAVAVRLARERGSEARMAAWLWEHQTGLSREAVFAAAREVAGITDMGERYQVVLGEIRRDVEVGHSLNVRGTPTYFINGVALGVVPRKNLEIAILHELRAAGRLAHGESK